MMKCQPVGELFDGEGKLQQDELDDIIQYSSRNVVHECLAQFQALPLSSAALVSIRNDLLRLVRQILLPTLLFKVKLWRQEQAENRRTALHKAVLHSFASDQPLDVLISHRLHARTQYITRALEKLLQTHLPVYTSSPSHGAPRIEAIEFTSGETHNNAKSPFLVQLDQQRLFYKSASATPYQLLRRIMETLLPDEAPVIPRVHPIDSFAHTVPYVEHAYTQDMRQYDDRFGVLCALAFLLRISDLHFENVIASETGPVVIDLEVFPHSYGPEHQLDWTGLIGDASLSAFTGGGHLWRMSSDPCVKEQRLRYRQEVYFDQNQPHPQGQKMISSERRLCLTEGFLRTGRRLLNQRSKLLSLSFQSDEPLVSRQLIRPTFFYMRLLIVGLQPVSASWHQHRAGLYRNLLEAPRMLAEACHELPPLEDFDLVHGDVPYFWSEGHRRSLFHHTGVELKGVLPVTPLEGLKEWLERMTVQRLEEEARRLVWSPV